MDGNNPPLFGRLSPRCVNASVATSFSVFGLYNVKTGELANALFSIGMALTASNAKKNSLQKYYISSRNLCALSYGFILFYDALSLPMR